MEYCPKGKYFKSQGVLKKNELRGCINGFGIWVAFMGSWPYSTFLNILV